MVRPRILITGGVWLVAHLGDTPTARGFWKKGAPHKLAVQGFLTLHGPNWSHHQATAMRQMLALNAVRVGRRCSSPAAARRRGDTAMVQTSRSTGVHFRWHNGSRRRFCEKHPWGVRQMLTPCSSLGLERAPRTAARIMPRGREVTSGRVPGGCAQAGCTRQREQPNGWIRPATDGCPRPV